MSIWNQVEQQIARVQTLAAEEPLNKAELQQAIANLTITVKNRKKPPQKVFTEYELEKALGAVAFEMQHFRCYSELWQERKLGEVCSAAHQAVLYALLLHMRILLDFFFNEPIQEDCHIDAFNILDSFEKKFPSSLRVRSDEIAEVCTYLNKLLVHLTATRWEKLRPAMDYYNHYAPILLDLITRFEDALPVTYRSVYDRHYLRWQHHKPVLDVNGCLSVVMKSLEIGHFHIPNVQAKELVAALTGLAMSVGV